MDYDLPFVELGAPTPGAPGERVLIKAKNVVVFGVENGYDLTPDLWEDLVSKLLLNTMGASYLFTAYEVVGPLHDIAGYFVAAGCFVFGNDASNSYRWLQVALATLPSYRKYRSGVWCVKAPADSSDPVQMDTKFYRNFVNSSQCVYMSSANFVRRGKHGIVWDIIPADPFGRIIVRPFSTGTKSPSAVTGLRPDLSVLWR